MSDTRALYNDIRQLLDTGHRGALITTFRQGQIDKKVYTEELLQEISEKDTLQTTLEETPEGLTNIVIKRLPVGVAKACLIEEIALQIRSRRLEGIKAFSDYSDEETRIVLELVRGADVQAVRSFLNALCASMTEWGMTQTALKTGELQYHDDGQGTITVTEPYCPESRLIVLGGGHIALPLVAFASRCGFAVTVCDDRPSFANRQRFPTAREVLCESFERVFDRLSINRFTFVVVITRGHRHDLDCLRKILPHETAYTGMIGSRRRVAAARQQLLDEGYPKDRLDAVRAPIGLDIGAETPEEIAVSILSEVIGYKRKASAVWPELDIAVLSALCENTDDSRALVTVVETKGSTPRESGAKMIVHPDGRIIGSIGGGCSESGVISEALDVIRDGGYKFVDVDMTGDVAEDEGMVCGGIMKVAIEQI